MTVGRLVEAGYPKAYASALVASGACTGILIPPSIAYIVIGLTLGVPTSTLFLAAIIPGIMVLGAIMLTNVALNRMHGYEHSELKFSFSVWLKALWDGRYAILVPFIILGGIYSGIFTPTEAAAIAVVTTILIGFFIGTLKPADVPEMLISSAKVNGVILPTVALSLPLAEAIAAIGIPQSVIQGMLALTESYVLIVLLMMVIFIIAGCVMEAVPNIVLIAPVLFPLAREIGMNDIHFCIMMVTSLGIGFVTPPIGLNLFVITGITGEPIMKVAGYAAPFVLSMLIVAFLLAYVPWFSLVLIN
jgi:tripartite ATP-independent transporter DctM subunit